MKMNLGDVVDQLSNNNGETDEDSDNDNEDDKKSTSSRFSYFSINSSKSETTSKRKNNKFANYVTCVQTSLKWKAALLRGRQRRAQPSLTDEDVKGLFLNDVITNLSLIKKQIRIKTNKIVKQ